MNLGGKFNSVLERTHSGQLPSISKTKQNKPNQNLNLEPVFSGVKRFEKVLLLQALKSLVSILKTSVRPL